MRIQINKAIITKSQDMEALFLTPTELVELTGYRQAAKQVAMLRRQGVPFHVNAAGHPKVARTSIEGSRQKKPKDNNWTPSWAADLR